VKISSLRSASQALSIIAINLGFLGPLYVGIPLAIFSCNYLKYGIFDCFFFVLQNGLSTGLLGGTASLYVFAGILLVFLVEALLLGTAWCAWICPFGLVQDLLSKGRAIPGIGYYRVPPRIQKHVKLIKYLFLGAVIVISLGIALPSIRGTNLRKDLYLPLCQVCPARPVFIYLQILFGILPPTTYVPPLSIVILPIFLVGALAVRRGWCIVCPNLALLSFFHRLNPISLFRRKERCTDCGTCSRVCVMDAVDEKAYGNVSRPECIRCFQCVENCAGDKSRSIHIFKKKVWESKLSTERPAKLPVERLQDKGYS
jgi:ferredoxin-type protein NapH